jgi:hypothetical protein
MVLRRIFALRAAMAAPRPFCAVCRSNKRAGRNAIEAGAGLRNPSAQHAHSAICNMGDALRDPISSLPQVTTEVPVQPAASSPSPPAMEPESSQLAPASKAS